MRVLAIDGGLTLGFAALGDGAVVAGSRAVSGNARRMGLVMRTTDQHVRQLIHAERPDVICFAAPHVAMRFDKKKKRWMPIDPDSIRPLFGIIAKVEEVADELRLRCVEISESEARRAFLTTVPKKSHDIKKAVMRACRLRGWPCKDDHAGDALCIAARVLERLNPAASHTMTPLFANQ